jgi:hypothetical protein
VVTKAISGTLNNNQQTRLVTLLHDPAVLLTNGIATDPLRAFTVRVLDDQVSTDPLVCRVRIEWAQQIADTPGGDFDLWITPWGPGWETVDIWVDRQPYGSYDFIDPAGNPTGSGDEPRVNEVNRFYTRVRNSGAVAASNVRLTYYVVTPPGVGDNGVWTPIQTKVLGAVPANGEASDFVNWVPIVGEHTCLKVMAEPQLGEVSGGNNAAQENIFNFQPAGASVPEPIAMPIAVRNPLDHPARVRLTVLGAPQGYRVYLPHRWVDLPARGEAKLDLLVVPTADLRALREAIDRGRKESRKDCAPRIRVAGWIERGYQRDVDGKGAPASCMRPIGGITARVDPKRLAAITLAEGEHDAKTIALRGEVRPVARGQKVRVDLRAESGATWFAVSETDERGVFAARFAVDPKGGAREFEAQAHLFNASELAPADSNVVYLER